MTVQRDLGLVWALSGGTLPVDQTKYEAGWVAEIPTYQQFNYMVQGIDGNVLHLAEEGVFDWQADITYQIGSRVKRSGIIYTCITTSNNNDPAVDSTNSYWVTGSYVGTAARLKQTDGSRVDFGTKSNTTWVGQEQTIYGKTPMTGYFTNDTSKNWALANFSGELVAIDLGTATDSIPDSRNINKTGPNSHRIFHEGHLPTAAEVVGGVGEAPDDGKLYARKGVTATSGEWIEVTTTSVSDEPPPPVRGAGQGWYNLANGQLYIDVDDGDSTQWVPSSTPYIPDIDDFNQTLSNKANTSGTYLNLRAQATTKADVGLSNVPNYSASSSTSSDSTTTLATSKAVKDAKINEVYTGTSLTNVDFPIGTILFCATTTGFIDKNAAVYVGLGANNSTYAVNTANSGIGTTLAGNWCSRGGPNATEAGGKYLLVQRVS